MNVMPFDVLIEVAKFGGDLLSIRMGKTCHVMMTLVNKRIKMNTVVPYLFAYNSGGVRRKNVIGKYVKCGGTTRVKFHHQVEALFFAGITSLPGWKVWPRSLRVLSFESLLPQMIPEDYHWPPQLKTLRIGSLRQGPLPSGLTHLTVSLRHYKERLPDSVVSLNLWGLCSLPVAWPSSLTTVHLRQYRRRLLDSIRALPPTLISLWLHSGDEILQHNAEVKWPPHLQKLTIKTEHITAITLPRTIHTLRIFCRRNILDLVLPPSVKTLQLSRHYNLDLPDVASDVTIQKNLKFNINE
jgi:hypothetical protein